LFVINCV